MYIMMIRLLTNAHLKHRSWAHFMHINYGKMGNGFSKTEYAISLACHDYTKLII